MDNQKKNNQNPNNKNNKQGYYFSDSHYQYLGNGTLSISGRGRRVRDYL